MVCGWSRRSRKYMALHFFSGSAFLLKCSPIYPFCTLHTGNDERHRVKIKIVNVDTHKNSDAPPLSWLKRPKKIILLIIKKEWLCTKVHTEKQKLKAIAEHFKWLVASWCTADKDLNTTKKPNSTREKEHYHIATASEHETS